MKLIVENGNVYCARRRKDVGIEECFSCLRFGTVEDGGVTITCKKSGPLSRLADLARVRSRWS
jgi:hypothetical protein